MAYERRPYPLIDEIKMHVFLWTSDNEWKKLPPAIKEAINITMNEIKISEALKNSGLEDERMQTDNSPANEKRKFIAIFKQKYTEYCDFVYNNVIDAGTLFIVGQLVQRLNSEGSNSLDYLTWFFDEFMRDEYNKNKYAPPSIKIVTSNFVVDKYLFLNKDALRVKKQDLQNIRVKNAIMLIATKFLEKVRDKEFGQKVLEFSRGNLTIRKFSSLFLAMLERHKEKELLNDLKSIIGE